MSMVEAAFIRGVQSQYLPVVVTGAKSIVLTYGTINEWRKVLV